MGSMWTRPISEAEREMRSAKNQEWWARLSPAERDAQIAKQKAGLKRYAEGKRGRAKGET